MASGTGWNPLLDKQDNLGDVTKNRKDKSGKKKKTPSSPTNTATTASPAGGNPWSILNYIPKLHKGGTVKKTGEYRLKKGEVVLTSPQANRYGIKKGKKKLSGTRKRLSIKA